MAILVWVSLWSVSYFVILKKAGWLRVNKVIEVLGLDFAELGGFDKDAVATMKEKVKMSLYKEGLEDDDQYS